MAKANRWVDFIRKWAKDNNTTYSCALSEGDCKEAYRAKYGIRKGVPAKKERERMGLEDVRPVAKKKSFKDQVEAVMKKSKKKLRIVEDEPVEEEEVVIKKKKTRRPPFREGIDEEAPKRDFWAEIMKASQEGYKKMEEKIAEKEKIYQKKSGGGFKKAMDKTAKGLTKANPLLAFQDSDAGRKTAIGLNASNPVLQLNERYPGVSAVLENLSYNYALPAMVSMGYYAYISAGEAGAVMLGLPPEAGRAGAEILWQEMVVKPGYDPRERQRSDELGAFADGIGRLGFSGGARSDFFYRL